MIMELTERVTNLELAKERHESAIKTLQQSDTKKSDMMDTFFEFMISTKAEAEGRDKTLKKLLSWITVLSILSPIITIVVNAIVTK